MKNNSRLPDVIHTSREMVRGESPSHIPHRPVSFQLFIAIAIMLMLSFTFIIPTTNVEASKPLGWEYSKSITIESDFVDTDLVNFPVLLNITNDADLASHAQSDGDDLVFMDSTNTTIYNHEIENYTDDGNYVNATIWVNVTYVSASTDTIFYMYYGNPSCSSREHIDDTWNSNYMAVYHMDDNTSTGVKDSTYTYADGAKVGVDEPNQISGLIANSQNFVVTNPNNDEHLTLSTTHDGFNLYDLRNTGWTFSFWIDYKGKGWSDNYDYVFLAKRDTQGNSYQFSAMQNDNNEFKLYNTAFQNSLDTQASLPTNCSVNVVIADVGSNNISVWVNSTYVGYWNLEVADDTDQIDTYVNGIGAVGNARMEMVMDELRFSSVTRNTSWIKADYENQKNASTFITIGSESFQREFTDSAYGWFDFNTTAKTYQDIKNGWFNFSTNTTAILTESEIIDLINANDDIGDYSWIIGEVFIVCGFLLYFGYRRKVR